MKALRLFAALPLVILGMAAMLVSLLCCDALRALGMEESVDHIMDVVDVLLDGEGA